MNVPASASAATTITIMRPIISILRRISQLSEYFPFNEGGKEHLIRKEITSLVEQIDCNMLGIEFSSTMPTMPVQVLCGNVYRNLPKFDSGIFAFPKTGDKLPLHDHPKMEGFIRIIKGKLLVTSFSLLNSEEEKKLRQEKGEEGNERIRPARFEGTYLLNEDYPEVLSLNSSNGNIHSIESMDGVGAFFDLLIPGYDQADGNVPCTYYQCDENEIPTVGKIYWLQIIPDTVKMGFLELPVINSLD